jgi:glycosyltransferase involved in cell wall biosynthesis
MNLPPEPNVPLVGFIGRLDYQKGPDLLLDALPNLVNLDCQVGGGAWTGRQGSGWMGGDEPYGGLQGLCVAAQECVP